MEAQNKTIPMLGPKPGSDTIAKPTPPLNTAMPRRISTRTFVEGSLASLFLSSALPSPNC